METCKSMDQLKQIHCRELHSHVVKFGFGSNVFRSKCFDPYPCVVLGLLCLLRKLDEYSPDIHDVGHASMVDRQKFFAGITTGHGVEPTVTHYGCMVDLLDRARRMQEAREVIKTSELPKWQLN
ncbi:hypothetical protein V6N13_079834 [Hibiscus sabdariffa]|uniref:Uncharacterized protein n=1 Tax=Hibiscus sabdariffa TaxID=183260 RepID=A0ABR2RT11_9ROSI